VSEREAKQSAMSTDEIKKERKKKRIRKQITQAQKRKGLERNGTVSWKKNEPKSCVMERRRLMKD